jgi:tRNA(Ile)-lysidine synthase
MSTPSTVPAWLSSRLLQAIQASLATGNASKGPFAVAVSGGIDSSMLAAHAAYLAVQSGKDLHIFHVHHGLQAVAHAWQQHVHALAYQLGVPCHSRRIRIAADSGKGIEAAAREGRYAALAGMARQCRVGHVLLAHHQDDQAETVLLRLLRGAGPAGLAAMAPVVHRDGLTYHRPWLNQPRAHIQQQADLFFQHTGWAPVHDPSNQDDRYTRSALRERLTPALNERWHGWQASLARHADQARELAELLDEVAAGLLAQVVDPQHPSQLSLRAWRALSPVKQVVVFRYWLAGHGLRMPAQARLNDALRQLRQLHALGHDRHMRLKHDHAVIHCHQGRVWIQAEPGDPPGTAMETR